MKHGISRLAALMLLTACLFNTNAPAQARRPSRAAAPQRISDWAFPLPGMKADNATGHPVYTLGHGFAATLPKDNAYGGQYTLVIISGETAGEFDKFAVQKGTPTEQLLANGVFRKVCRLPAGVAYLGPKEVESKLTPGATETEYIFRTASGATASIFVAEDMSMAIVAIDPPRGRGAGGQSSAVRPRQSGGDAKRSKGYTFAELRTLFMGNHRADILRAFGKPHNTYDAGESVFWTYRNLAYDPITGRRKNVTIWFDKYGFVNRIGE